MIPRIQDNESFVTLLQVAQEDPSVRAQLLTILDMDKQHRQSALATFCDQMTLQRKPKDFVAAISFLAQDNVALRVRELLLCKEQPPHKVIYIAKWILSALIGGTTALALGAILMLIADTFLMPIPVAVQIAVLAVAVVSGIVLGIMSLAHASWHWILVCAIIYGLIGLILRGNVF